MDYSNPNSCHWFTGYSYERKLLAMIVFSKTVLNKDDFDPLSILTDVEPGTIKPVKSLLPNLVHKGNFTN
jgi:hypothetical protein